MEFKTALNIIKEIEMLASSAEEEMCENENDVDEIMDNLFKDLKALDKNNGWIPVDEMLPEENWQHVLITVDRWSTIADEWIYDDVKLTRWSKERNEFDYERGCWEDKKPKIKAWMSLPEPYKGA